MNSYNANSSTVVKVGSKATIPVGVSSQTAPFPTGETFATLINNTQTNNGLNTISNYPDTGNTTTFGVVDESAVLANVYQITSTTAFPSGDARSNYAEIYLVKDGTAVGVWTNADPVGSISGSPATWATNSAARVSMTLTFANTDTRSEMIEDNATLYSFPDINGSLVLKALSLPAIDTTTTVTYSSVVGYVTKPSSVTQSSYWLSTATPPNIVGLRYYSEVNGTWSSVSFERITAEPQNLSLLSLADLQSIIFTNKKNTTTYTTLGTSVLRENATTKTMQTLLVNNVRNLTYQLQFDSTGTIVYVMTSAGQLIQAGL